MGGRVLARRSPGGGERIPASRTSRSRLTTALASLALTAGVVTYAAADASRLSELVVAIGATGVALAVLGLLRPWAWLVAGAIAAAGAAYAVELSLGPRTIDAWAPLVAAALFVAAELGFWSIEPCTARPERAVVLRRLVFLAASAFVVALVGSVLLYATTGASGGIGLESLGVTAAVVALAIIAFLARRSRESGSAPA